jgi:hypothetical protein
MNDYIEMQNKLMGDMNGEIHLSDEAIEQIEAVCFEIIAKEYETGIGKQTLAFWQYTRNIPAIYSALNLYFEREDINGVGRWTVYGYRIDIRKEKPFWTVESSKTLIFRNKLLHPDDLYRGQEDYEDYEDYED